MIVVFDSCALIALAKDEPGADAVEQLLSDPSAECYVHAVNLCEFQYDGFRIRGESTTAAAISDFLAQGLIVREDFDADFRLLVARRKAGGRVALADCCGLALAERLGGTFYTADRHELEKFAAAGAPPIIFIR